MFGFVYINSTVVTTKLPQHEQPLNPTHHNTPQTKNNHTTNEEERKKQTTTIIKKNNLPVVPGMVLPLWHSIVLFLKLFFAII